MQLSKVTMLLKSFIFLLLFTSSFHAFANDTPPAEQSAIQDSHQLIRRSALRALHAYGAVTWNVSNCFLLGSLTNAIHQIAETEQYLKDQGIEQAPGFGSVMARLRAHSHAIAFFCEIDSALMREDENVEPIYPGDEDALIAKLIQTDADLEKLLELLGARPTRIRVR